MCACVCVYIVRVYVCTCVLVVLADVYDCPCLSSSLTSSGLLFLFILHLYPTPTASLPGSPSDPSMPVVSVEGSSVFIQLSTRYPGTNARGQFRFSLIFSAASTAKRQSLQPTEVRVDPTGLDSSVTTTHTLTDVTAGSYSVSVLAENENGMSQDVTVSFVVEGMRDAEEPAVLYIQVFGHCCVYMCVCVRSTYTHT